MLMRCGLLAAADLEFTAGGSGRRTKISRPADQFHRAVGRWRRGRHGLAPARPALERELGVPVNVINRTGGNGVTGHTAIASAPPDGYTIGMATSEIAYLKTTGLADITPDTYDIISTVLKFPAGIT